MSGLLDMLADFSLNYNKSVNVVGRDRIELATTAFGHKQRVIPCS